MKLRVVKVDKGYIVQRRRYFGLYWDCLNYKRKIKEIIFSPEVCYYFKSKEGAIQAAKDFLESQMGEKEQENRKVPLFEVVWDNYKEKNKKSGNCIVDK